MRAFGEAVEAASGSGGTVAEQLTRACTDALARALPDLLDRLTKHIDERLAHDRQRVNLNVRAPKRARSPQVSRDISGAGRPLPIAKFLDEIEREDPAWKVARRSFAPSFGMLAQILKKQKVRQEGGQSTYVEQNHRAQILYVEEDRPVLEVAWAISSAHREELATRAAPAPALAALPAPPPAAPPRPSVLDMLMRG